jgi:ubiquitin-like modifier-activating enzyme ATG7
VTTSADEQVVDAYKKDGFDMLLHAFNETDYLEKLTGLDELHKESEAVLDSLEWEEGSEEDF